MAMVVLPLSALVPGGIKPTDHRHHIINDGTCSRCRRSLREDDVPLMCWIGEGGADMLIYCEDCTRMPRDDSRNGPDD